jgi:hypothetical protein
VNQYQYSRLGVRIPLSPPKQYDQILRQQDFLFYQNTEGSLLPRGVEGKTKKTEGFDHIVLKLPRTGSPEVIPLSPPKQYDQILRQQDFLFYQNTEGSLLPRGVEGKTKNPEGFDHIVLKPPPKGSRAKRVIPFRYQPMVIFSFSLPRAGKTWVRQAEKNK